jgi:hypothetical protein
MHDGQNLFNASTSFAGIAWQVQDAADALIYQGLFNPYLFVNVGTPHANV